MARGKKSLIETSDLPIVEKEEEEGSIPYFIIDDEYGISCSDLCEILVKKRKASRTVSEDNKPHHIETYWTWDNVCYPSNFSLALSCYCSKKELELKKRKLVKSKDYKDILNVQKEIKDIIYKCLDGNGINKEFLSFTSVYDERVKLEEEIKQLRDIKNKCLESVESLMDLIKEKRSIVIKNTEPKKHRTKLENE